MKTKMKNMKITKRAILLLTIFLLIVLAISCQTSGEYLPLSADETVIGAVQTTFSVRSTFFSMKRVRDNINKEAYIKLQEAAAIKYSGNIDIRNIVWVTGKPVKNNEAFTELFASGKVIRFE